MDSLLYSVFAFFFIIFASLIPYGASIIGHSLLSGSLVYVR